MAGGGSVIGGSNRAGWLFQVRARRRRVGNGFRLGFVDSLSRVVERSRSSGASVRVDKLGVLAASRVMRVRVERRRIGAFLVCWGNVAAE